MTSISNMPIEKAGVAMQGTEEFVWDVYAKSVKMSTYLVAFVVSKFKEKFKYYEIQTVKRVLTSVIFSASCNS